MERRIATRTPLDIPYMLTLVSEDGRSAPVMLADISASGMRFTLSPGMADMNPMNNAKVTVNGFPPQVARQLDGITGTIVWIIQDQCGIRLDMPINLPLGHIVGTCPL